jgi:hypothetical protein
MGSLQNAFPASDKDRHEIWNILVLEDTRDFLRGDFSRCRTRFLEPAFFSLDAAGSADPERWKISFPALDDYAARWLEYSRATVADIGDVEEAERALLETSNLTEIDVQGDTALARKKFDGSIPLRGGRRSHLYWQTLYWLKRIGGEWKIVGFLGYLPYNGAFHMEVS